MTTSIATAQPSLASVSDRSLHNQSVLVDEGGVLALKILAERHMNKSSLQPTQPALWRQLFASSSISALHNSLEVFHTAFFRRPEVSMFANEVVQSGGIFRHLWGDSVLRTLTAAIFLQPEDMRALEFDFSHPCES